MERSDAFRRGFCTDNPRDKHWKIALTLNNLRALRQLQFEITWELEDWETAKTRPPDEIKLEWTGKLAELYPFQKDGVVWLTAHKGRGLIGDEMGLGKTVQALAWLALNAEVNPAIVVCPASLKLNWAREAQRWTNLVPIVCNGTKASKDQLVSIQNTNEQRNSGRLFIINYDVLGDWVKWLKTMAPKAVVLDESHYIKNPAAKRTKAVKQLCHGVHHVIALSGTPIVNRPVELLEAVNLVDPLLFPKRWAYLQRYCGAKWNGYGWDFTGATNMTELHEKLTGSGGCMLRRLKANVLKDLPDKQRIVLPFEITNRQTYTMMERETWDTVQKSLDAIEGTRKSYANALAKIEALKQTAVAGKIEAVKEWIAGALDDVGKLVVFCHHHTVVDALKEAFAGKCVVISGETANAERMKHVDRFQTDPTCQLFIGTLAAIEGITLTAASNVAFVELWWTPGQHKQAEDRTHRIGQSESVSAYYLVAENTIEEKIARMLDKKQSTLDAVLDGKDTEEGSLLRELLEEHRKAHQNTP